MSDTILLIEARQLAEPVVRGYRLDDNWDVREALIAFGEEYVSRRLCHPVHKMSGTICSNCSILWGDYDEFCRGCGFKTVRK